jgi:hypothetical protein
VPADIKTFSQMTEELWVAHSALNRHVGDFQKLGERVATSIEQNQWAKELGVSMVGAPEPTKFMLAFDHRVLQFSFRGRVQGEDGRAEVKVHLLPEFPEFERWREMGNIFYDKSGLTYADVNGEKIQGVSQQTSFTHLVCVYVLTALGMGFAQQVNLQLS